MTIVILEQVSISIQTIITNTETTVTVPACNMYLRADLSQRGGHVAPANQ